jgi:vacuolar-type H+-ATPase subunit H
MVKDIIDGIKETEAKAAGIVEEARKKKGELIAAAREAARKGIEDAGKQGGEQVKQALERAGKEAERRIEEIDAGEASDREEVRQAAARNVSRAVETVIERVLK